MAFEEQVLWLRQNGFRFYKMADVLRDDLPEKAVFLTFDDGFEDNYRHLFPILKKYGIPATIYLVVNRFKGDWSTDRMTEKVSAELNDQSMLSHKQVKEMAESGLIEFGSHTLDHARLNQLSAEEAMHQIVASKQQIEACYGAECSSFAYPFGFYDETAVKLVKKAGFHNACTTEDGTDENRVQNRFRLRRIMVSGNDSMRKFIRKMEKGGGR